MFPFSFIVLNDNYKISDTILLSFLFSNICTEIVKNNILVFSSYSAQVLGRRLKISFLIIVII